MVTHLNLSKMDIQVELQKLIDSGIFTRDSETKISNRHASVWIVEKRNFSCPEYLNAGTESLLCHSIGYGIRKYHRRASDIVSSCG